jgi:hypothetical protein
MFLGLPDPEPFLSGSPRSGSNSQRTRVLLSLSKNSKKTLFSYCFVTSSQYFIFENDVNVNSKGDKQINFSKIIFCCLLEGL